MIDSSLWPISLKILVFFYWSQLIEMLLQFFSQIGTGIRREDPLSHGGYLHGISVQVLVVYLYSLFTEELEVTLHIFWALALIMASLLAPVAHGLFPSFLSFTSFLGRQGGSAGLLVLGLGP